MIYSFPKTGTVWYIEAPTGPKVWFQVRKVRSCSHNPTRVYFDVLNSNGGKYIDWVDITTWYIFGPKELTAKESPEYFL